MSVTAPALPSATPHRPAPISPEEIARTRAPFRAAALLCPRTHHDEVIDSWELQHRGTRSRSWTAGCHSNQEASVSAFDIMVADRYAIDGSHTRRGSRTETASARRRATRALGTRRNGGRSGGEG